MKFKKQKKGTVMLNKAMQIVGLLFILFTHVYAQGINIGPELGFQKATDADDGKFTGGVALRVKVIPVLGFEASVAYRSESYSNGAATVTSWPVMVTGLIYPIPIVYGAIGTGWYNTSFTYDRSRFLLLAPSDETKQKVGWHLGGGVELPIVGTGSKIIADIRYVFIDYDFKSVPGMGDKKSDFYVFTVGILF